MNASNASSKSSAKHGKGLRTSIQAGEMGVMASAYKGDMSRFELRAGSQSLLEGWTQDASTFANSTYGS